VWSGAFLMDFVVLVGLWWNSGWSGGFLVNFVALGCLWYNSVWWISGGFCGSGWFVVEVWVVRWNSGGFLVEGFWWIPGRFLLDFVALVCFWWNSGWWISYGFLVCFW
jgi:hypothetical protein